MKKTVFIILFLILTISLLDAQDTGVTVYGNYSAPIAGLSERVKPTIAYGFGVGAKTDKDWFMEGLLEYTRYDEPNNDGYMAGKIELSLEHVALLYNARYFLTDQSILKPYLNFGVGLFYWKGVRGEVQPDETVLPAIPYMEKSIQEEWNLGFRTGAGLEWMATDFIGIDLCAYYRFIVGDLWPAMQPHVELENVSGFQSVNAAVHLRYHF